MKRKTLYITGSVVCFALLGVLLWQYYYPYKQNPVFNDTSPDLARRCEAVLNDYRNGKYGDELFYLATDAGESIAIFKENEAPHVIYEESQMPKGRWIYGDQFREFSSFISRKRIDYLKDKDMSYYMQDDSLYQYMHCTKKGTAVVFMCGLRAETTYSALVNEFFHLAIMGVNLS